MCIIVNVGDNGIVSIEHISRMKAENLRTLELDMNYITTIRVLRKCVFPLLK